MENTRFINSASFAGEKTPAKASFLQILKSKEGTPTRAKIDASDLNPGAYYYEVKVGDRRVKDEKLIIVK